MPTTLINLNNTTPAAPSGGLNVLWQFDSNSPINVSAYVDLTAVVTNPGGSDTQLQFNSSGTFGGVSTSSFGSGVLTFTPSSDSITPLVLTSTTGSLTASLLDINNDAVVATTPNLGTVMIRGKSLATGAHGFLSLLTLVNDSDGEDTQALYIMNAGLPLSYITGAIVDTDTPLIQMFSNTTGVTLAFGVNDFSTESNIDSSGGIILRAAGDIALNGPGASLTITGTTIEALGSLIVTTHTPSSASDTGVKGTVTWDGSFIYVCTATNTWKRVGIATW